MGRSLCPIKSTLSSIRAENRQRSIHWRSGAGWSWDALHMLTVMPRMVRCPGKPWRVRSVLDKSAPCRQTDRSGCALDPSQTQQLLNDY